VTDEGQQYDKFRHHIQQERILRQVGTRRFPEITFHASGKLLEEGARFNETLTHLTDQVGYTPKGVYRFASHEEANQFDLDCLAQAMGRLAVQRDKDAQDCLVLQRALDALKKR
jgi:hypothetical protein